MPEDTTALAGVGRIAADTPLVSAHPDVARSERSWQHIVLSRVGAVTGRISTGPMRRAFALSTRFALLLAGTVVLAIGVSVTLWTGLGAGPLDLFIGAVRVRTGLPLSVAVWMVVGAVIATAWALGRRPGPGTIVGPFVVGVVMQVATSWLSGVTVPDALVVRVALHLLAIGAIGVGAGALIVSGLGAGSGELLASAASTRSGRAEHHVRLAFELSWLVLGVALGGPAGLGTVLVALTIGWSVANGRRIVDRSTGAAVQLLATSAIVSHNGRTAALASASGS